MKKHTYFPDYPKTDINDENCSAERWTLWDRIKHVLAMKAVDSLTRSDR